MRTQDLVRGYLGVAGQNTPIPRALARELRLAVTSGVRVMSIEAHGPAARAGIEAGDIVLAIGGSSVSGVDDLHRFLTEAAIDKTIALSVLRRARLEQIPITPVAAE